MSRKTVLILGATGMLGHKLWQGFEQQFETWATVRRDSGILAIHGLDPSRVITGIEANDLDKVAAAVASVRPGVVINCIGIIKQLPGACDPISSITINSLFPHRLAQICRKYGARLIHISTDCVFSGEKGMYTERDRPDPVDLYGRSKLLGEVVDGNCLTIRTSIIGRELSAHVGLLEWFLHQRGSVQGFRNAIYTGLTTLELSRIVGRIIESQRQLTGVYQVSTDPISKYELLCLLKRVYGTPVDIVPADEPCIDRSLDSSRFRAETGYRPPSWEQMIAEMFSDSATYCDWNASERNC